jgi:tetrahydromethanopterin S-methyltransferase subunit G
MSLNIGLLEGIIIGVLIFIILLCSKRIHELSKKNGDLKKN